MYGLLEIAYPKEKQEHFESVFKDADDNERMLMKSVVAKALKDVPKILPSHGLDWILCTLSMHERSIDDTFRIYQSIVKKLPVIVHGLAKQIDRHGKIAWRDSDDAADTCLIGLSFFKENLEKLHQRRAAPSVSYYMQAGALAFKRAGFDSIGEEFSQWVSFIEDELAVTSIS